MSTTEKRPAEELGNDNVVKKQDTFEKGVAPIKAEFIVDVRVAEAYDDEEPEGEHGQDLSNTKKKGKKRGQNKKRDLRQQHEEVRLCSSLVDPEGEKECRFGAEKCRSTHNVEEYLNSKPKDIDGTCPVYQALGYCPIGLKCRWLYTHYNTESKTLAKDEDRIKQAAIDNYEVNVVAGPIKYSLQKRSYEFDTSTTMINWLDNQVQSEENLAKIEELKKNNQSTYVDQPIRPGEKKKLNLKNAKIVSPLTTVGNLPYRRLMKTLGADITYSEMALSLPLVQGTNAEWALPKAHVSEYPGFGVQIATSKHWAASKAAEVIYRETTNVSELNLNSGCPIDLLYRQGQGSALMEQPARLLRILKGMNACAGDIPVTLKIRTGTKDGKNTAGSLVERVLEEQDVAAITLHGRSRQQRYTREPDWNYIGDVAKIVQKWNINKQEDKDRCDMPDTFFIGNGDIFTYEDWHNAVNTEGVDSVMVARGALIKPWIFEEVESEQYLDKSATERLEILKQYANFAIEHWGSDEYGIGLSRRFMCEFLSFTHRYIPVGILERLPPKLNQRPPHWKGRNELETLLGSSDYKDWIKITEMFLGPAGEAFQFVPKHKSNSYEKSRD